MRWQNGRTRRSQNPYPEEVFQDCLTKWEESAAHSILARRFHANKGRIHLRRPTCHSHFSLATRRRTIHSGLRVIRMNVEGAHLRDGDKLGISGDGYLWAFLGNLTPNSVRTTVAAVLSDTSGRMRPLVLRPSGSL